MGYRCPVCGDPQADDVHLANHLAFTAMVRGGDHESWLDEHVPDWGQCDDEGLAAQVTEFADSAEYPKVFEDTTDHAHEGETPHHHDNESAQHRQARSELPDGAEMLTDVDEDVDEVIERARELTRQRRDGREEPTDEDDT